MSSLNSKQSVLSSPSNPQTFSDQAFPLFYVVYAAITAVYDQCASLCATIADQMTAHGLRQKKVVEAGCGLGISTLRITSFVPSQIVAFDSSAPMIDLFRRVIDPEPGLDDLFSQPLIREALGGSLEICQSYLQKMRRAFCDSAFCRLNGSLLTPVCSSLELEPNEILSGTEIVIGSHFLHWPAGMWRDQLSSPETETAGDRIEAISRSLKPFSDILEEGGVAVFLTPDVFVEDDLNPERNADVHLHSGSCHPIRKYFDTALERLLKKELGFSPPSGRKNRLFRTGELSEAARRAGFCLDRVVHQELYHCYSGDLLEALVAGIPMNMGNLNITWRQKLELVNRVATEVRPLITTKDRHHPFWSQVFVFCFRK